MYLPPEPSAEEEERYQAIRWEMEYRGRHAGATVPFLYVPFDEDAWYQIILTVYHDENDENDDEIMLVSIMLVRACCTMTIYLVLELNSV